MPPIAAIDRNILPRAYVPIDDENSMIVIVEKKGVISDQEQPAGARQAIPAPPCPPNFCPTAPI